MGQAAAKEAIQQLSGAIELGLQPGRQPTEAPLVSEAVHPDDRAQYHVVINMSIQGSVGLEGRTDHENSDRQAHDSLSVLGHGSVSVGLEGGLSGDSQAQDGLQVLGFGSMSAGLEGGLSDDLSVQGSVGPQVEHNTGRFRFVVGFVLGPNRSDPIWRLRLIAGFNLVVFAMVIVFFLAGYFHGVHATDRRVMLLTIPGIPVVVAGISLFASCWIASHRDRQSNWTTGLSVANVSMLGGALAIYFVLQLIKIGN